jgi:RNA polymerase sigma factor (sigma-70 family)
MNETLDTNWMTASQNERLSETIGREGGRLRNFIRRRVADEAEAEDILQDVFYELVEAYRLMKPIEQVSGWMFRVARNRIIDFFRKKKTVSLSGSATGATSAGTSQDSDDYNAPPLEEMLPSPDAGPDAVYARNVLLDALEAAIDELPKEQREVFIAHEVEGRSFKEISAKTGVSVNTLLSRKHQAVLHLREQLQDIHDELLGPTL